MKVHLWMTSMCRSLRESNKGGSLEVARGHREGKERGTPGERAGSLSAETISVKVLDKMLISV